MAQEIIMPKLGMTMEEGTVTRWFLKEGDKIEKGDVLLEVETDKASLEVESIASGYLLKKYVQDGETIPVMSVIGMIGDLGEIIGESAGEKSEECIPETEAYITNSPQNRSDIGRKKNDIPFSPGLLKATPAAKRLAKEKGIEIINVTPNEHGIVDEKSVAAHIMDVQSFTEPASVERKAVEASYIDMTRIQKAAAESLLKTWTSMAMVTNNVEVDMTQTLEIVALLNQRYEKEGFKFTITDVMLKIISMVILKNTFAAVYREEDQFRKLESIDIGIAVDSPNGLVVPVLRNVDKKNVMEINLEKKKLIQKAFDGKLTPYDFGGACTTLTNVGNYRMEVFTPLITYPESCIYGTGRINKKPVVENDEIVIRPMMWMNFTYDHCVMDGAQAALMINDARDLMEKPGLAVACGENTE